LTSPSAYAKIRGSRASWGAFESDHPGTGDSFGAHRRFYRLAQPPHSEHEVRIPFTLAVLGDGAYTFGLAINHHLNKVRRARGYEYWSLAACLKLRVKNAVQYMGSFADALAAEARGRGLDGVVCGHIHHAEIRDLGGVLYCNDGDWVESCTALVEHLDGRLEILRWAEQRLFDPMGPHERTAIAVPAEDSHLVGDDP